MSKLVLTVLSVGFIGFAVVECGCAASSSLAAISTPRPRLAEIIPSDAAPASATPASALAAPLPADCTGRLESARADRRECLSTATARCSDERQVSAQDRPTCLRDALEGCRARYEQLVVATDCRYDTRFARR